MVTDGLRMGQEYHSLTTEEGRTYLGPPHLHIFGCTIPALVRTQGLPEDAKAILEPFVKLMTAMDREGMNDLMTYNEGNQKADQANMHIMLNPMAISPFLWPTLLLRYREKTADQNEMPKATMAELRLHIIKGLAATGGVVKSGSPPPGALERAVQQSVQEQSTWED
eukprot:2485182-Pyramimonas_sp.AAC.1